MHLITKDNRVQARIRHEANIFAQVVLGYVIALQHIDDNIVLRQKQRASHTTDLDKVFEILMQVNLNREQSYEVVGRLIKFIESDRPTLKATKKAIEDIYAVIETANAEEDS